MESACASRNIPRMRGNRLKQIRKANGLGQKDVAERAGYSIPQISRWESGDDAIPSPRLPILARAYSCTIGEIFEEPMVLSAGAIEQMLAMAQAELPSGSKYGDWPRSVASALHAQLARLREDWLATRRREIESALGESSPPRDPTRPTAQA